MVFVMTENPKITRSLEMEGEVKNNPLYQTEHQKKSFLKEILETWIFEVTRGIQNMSSKQM